MAGIPAGAIGSFPGSVMGPTSGVFFELDPGEFIEVYWKEDPRRVARDILKVADYYEDMSVPLVGAEAVVNADIKRHFNEETDPDGNPWRPLNEAYLTYKESQGQDTRILRRYGDLYAAATDRVALVIDGNDLFYSTAYLPYYWYWMQMGTGSEEDWGAAADYAARIEAAGSYGIEGGRGSLGIGTGKATPARPFIGLSAEAEEEVFTVFDLWFAGGTNVFIHGESSGWIQERGPGGRFGARIT